VTFGTRLVVIALAAFAVGTLTGSALMPALWRRIRTRPTAARAATLLRLRLLPVTTSVVAAALTIASFVRFEPRSRHESTGLVLLAFAGATIGLLAVAAARMLRAHLATRRVVRSWMASAEPIGLPEVTIPAYAISSSFPVVAVVGVFRPTLVVARSVLAACSHDQLRAVMAHERGHVTRQDNLRRAVLASLPDVTTWLPVARHIHAAWDGAIEEAADDESARLGTSGPLHLAEALIRVARLAPTGQPAMPLPASALYRGESIEHRVSRLLAAPAEVVDSPRAAWRQLVLGAGVLTACLFGLQAVHALIEAAVTFLP
jgi:Zn-dependent protease with chaperone function